MKKMIVDPPSGWRYGFPREYNPRNGQTMAEWLVECGYPSEDIEFAMRYMRMWEKNEHPSK